MNCPAGRRHPAPVALARRASPRGRGAQRRAGGAGPDPDPRPGPRPCSTRAKPRPGPPPQPVPHAHQPEPAFGLPGAAHHDASSQRGHAGPWPRDPPRPGPVRPPPRAAPRPHDPAAAGASVTYTRIQGPLPSRSATYPAGRIRVPGPGKGASTPPAADLRRRARCRSLPGGRSPHEPRACAV